MFSCIDYWVIFDLPSFSSESQKNNFQRCLFVSRDEGKWAFINVQPGGEVCHRRLGVETMKLAQYTRT